MVQFILMHVGVRSTADALPAIIANLQGRGFHLVTISNALGISAQIAMKSAARNARQFAIVAKRKFHTQRKI